MAAFLRLMSTRLPELPLAWLLLMVEVDSPGCVGLDVVSLSCSEPKWLLFKSCWSIEELLESIEAVRVFRGAARVF